VRSRRAVGRLRTTWPLMGRRRWPGTSRGGRRRPIPIPGSRASANDHAAACYPEVTVRDQSPRPKGTTREGGTGGYSTRRSNLRPVGTYPESCVPAALRSPARPADFSPKPSAAPVPAHTAPVESPTDAVAALLTLRSSSATQRRASDHGSTGVDADASATVGGNHRMASRRRRTACRRAYCPTA
jgi:hypothetical protein